MSMLQTALKKIAVQQPKERTRAWMIERKIDPEKLRFLFLRLYEEFINGGQENE